MKSRLRRLLPVFPLLLALLPACTRDSGMGPVQRLNEVEGGAASFSWAYYTSIVAAGDRAAVAWMNQNGKMNRNVVVRTTGDRGQTWSAETPLNIGDYANTVSVVPTLAILPGDGNMLALWQARRNEAGQKFVLTRKSADFGSTWGEPTVLNTKLQAFLPVLAQRGDDLVVAWTDERNVLRDIYSNRSRDAGTKWLPRDRRVSTQPKNESGGPTAAIGAGEHAYVVWEQRPHKSDDSGPHLRFSTSPDMGASWTAPAEIDTGESKVSPIWPQLVWSEGRLTLAWSGGITGEGEQSWLWLSSSTDDGKTWAPPTQVYNGPTQPFFHLRAVGPQVYFAWHGGTAEAAGGIYWNASDDGGKTWRHAWDAAERLDSGAKGSAMHPRIGFQGDVVGVTWHDGYERVLVSASRDRGRTWPLSNATVTEREDPSDQLRNPQVAVSENAAYVLWERWPDKKKFIKTFADVDKTLPKDAYVRRVDLP